MSHFLACLSGEPDHQGALFCRAVALRVLGQTDQAIVAYQKMLIHHPNNAEAWSNLGNLWFESGSLAECRQALQEAVRLKPQLSNAWFNLGNLAVVEKQPSKAVEYFLLSLEHKADFAPALINLSNLWFEMAAYDKALASLDRAVLVAPEMAEGWLNRANTKKEMGDFTGALNDYQQAEKRLGQTVSLLANRGDLFSKIGCEEAALRDFNAALNQNPQSHTALLNRGNLYKQTGFQKKAQQDFQAVLAFSPDHVEAKFNLALLQLQSEAFAKGWQGYEARWESARFPTAKLVTKKPLYTREFGVVNRLLLWAEQGIGDEIMFASLLNHARSLADQLIVQADDRLVDLFSRSFADIIFLPRSRQVDEADYDAHLPMGSLPGLFLQDATDFLLLPAAYLRPHPDRLAWAREQLAEVAGPVWGISWQSQNKATGKLRSIDLAGFLSCLNRPDVRYLNLQYGDMSEQISAARRAGHQIIDMPTIDKFSDIEGVAALAAAADKVITIDNVIVHLAGAMGLPAQLWLPKVPEWRWAGGQGDCRWYPSVSYHFLKTAGV